MKTKVQEDEKEERNKRRINKDKQTWSDKQVQTETEKNRDIDRTTESNKIREKSGKDGREENEKKR